MLWLYHYLFNSLPIEGHLICFQFLAVINNAYKHLCRVNTSEHKSSFLWYKCPGVQLLVMWYLHAF